MLNGSQLTRGDELVNNSRDLKYNDPWPSEPCKILQLTAHEISFEISVIFWLKQRTNFVEFHLHSFCTVL